MLNIVSASSCLVVPNSLRPHELQPARLLCPWGFSRQEYWSGLPCLPPENLPNPGNKLRSPVFQVILYHLSHRKPGKNRQRRDQIANICWSTEKIREFQKNYFCFIDYVKPLTVWITTNCGKFLMEKEMAWQPTPVFLPGESPWTKEPGGLRSMGLKRVGHD